MPKSYYLYVNVDKYKEIRDLIYKEANNYVLNILVYWADNNNPNQYVHFINI